MPKLVTPQLKNDFFTSTLSFGGALAILAAILQFYVSAVNAGAVSLGVLYMAATIKIYGSISPEALRKTRTRAFVFLGLLLKFPLLFLSLYLLSRMGGAYLFGALIGALSFLPAAVWLALKRE